MDNNDPLSLNLYAYVKNNPLIYVDFNGHMPKWMNNTINFLKGVGTYIKDSGEQVLLGNYSDKTTILGTAGQIAVGFTGVDFIGDFRDLTYDLSNWKWTWGHAGFTVLDTVALVPVIGVIKYSDEAVTLAKGLDKSKDAIKNANNIIDTSTIKSGAKITNDTLTEGASKVNGWKVGDSIDNYTKAGNQPSWSTVKSRYWKNEAYYNPNKYTQSNLDLMSKGKAPLVKFTENGKLYPMELHHPNGRIDNNFWNFKPLTPWSHSVVDPFRYWKP
jgi:hypothetical protein